jgi:hypothetical protein
MHNPARLRSSLIRTPGFPRHMVERPMAAGESLADGCEIGAATFCEAPSVTQFVRKPVALSRGRSIQCVTRLVTERQRGRRLPPRGRDLEPEAGSRSAGSNRKRRGHSAADSLLLLVGRPIRKRVLVCWTIANQVGS